MRAIEKHEVIMGVVEDKKLGLPYLDFKYSQTTKDDHRAWVSMSFSGNQGQNIFLKGWGADCIVLTAILTFQIW